MRLEVWMWPVFLFFFKVHLSSTTSCDVCALILCSKDFMKTKQTPKNNKPYKTLCLLWDPSWSCLLHWWFFHPKLGRVCCESAVTKLATSKTLPHYLFVLQVSHVPAGIKIIKDYLKFLRPSPNLLPEADIEGRGALGRVSCTGRVFHSKSVSGNRRLYIYHTI